MYIDYGQIINEFLAETAELAGLADTLPLETAVELYDMYDEAAHTATEHIATIDPALRVEVCRRRDDILERVVDFDPYISLPSTHTICTPAVQYFRRWGNAELLKDKGVTGYTLAKEVGAHPVMYFCTKPEDYPYLEQLPGLELLYTDAPGGTKEVYADHLSENYANMDTLIIHGMYEETLGYLEQYRKLRPDGKVYCGLDLNGHRMREIEWNYPQIAEFTGGCDIVATSCRSLRDALNANPQVNFQCCWIPSGFYNPAGTKVIADAEKKKNVILTVGRIGTKQKNNAEMLVGFALAADSLPGWSLRLVGGIEPEFLPIIDEFFEKRPDLKERVIFTGEITSKEELFKEYAEAKVFTLTSLVEGGPNVLAEALFHGCMFVTSDIDAADDITNNGDFGETYKLFDTDALSRALVKVCKKATKAGMQKHIPKALAYANRHFDWHRNAKKLAYMLYR